jgi:outer membrane lipoprotein-sorting protein
MLQEPVSSRGRLYLTKPDSVRWEFSLPEEMAFVIANGEYIGYYPARKKAERRDFHRWSEQVFRYFGLGQGSVELSRMYDITLEDAEAAPDGVRVLRLEPKKRRARKRIEEVQLWVSEKTWLPVRVEYQTRNGGNREIVFRGMQVNPDLATGLYEVNLPPDVQVTRGASGLGTALQTSPGPGSH